MKDFTLKNGQPACISIWDEGVITFVNEDNYYTRDEVLEDGDIYANHQQYLLVRNDDGNSAFTVTSRLSKDFDSSDVVAIVRHYLTFMEDSTGK